jgi:hypothetical protein
MKESISIFISSKQVEFETERAVLADKIRSIPFLEPVLAEEWPPQHSTPEDLFLDQVRNSPIYIGLFHCIYSKPTEMEYRAAVENPYREILIYLKHSPNSAREPALHDLISEFKQRHVIAEFTTISDLLPVFTHHIRNALTRMIALLQKLGEGAPIGRAQNSILTRRWIRQQEQLQKLGLLKDMPDTATWIQHLSESLNAISSED